MEFNFKKIVAVGLMSQMLAGAAFAQEVTLKLGHLANEDNAWH